MRKYLIAGLAASLIVPAAANAAVVVTSSSATNPYSGPVPTYDFETLAPLTGGSIVANSVSGQHLRPFGSVGNFMAVGIFDGSPAILNLAAFDRIGTFSLLWGSMDIFNLLEFLDGSGNVLFSINGQSVKDLSAPAPGNVNRVVNFTFTDVPTQQAISAARFSSSLNAFEVDNVSILAVPEPATWLLLILGFFGLSYAVRRRSPQSKARIRFA